MWRGAIRVGKLLAEKYGIPFYTRKNLMEMAEDREECSTEMDRRSSRSAPGR